MSKTKQCKLCTKKLDYRSTTTLCRVHWKQEMRISASSKTLEQLKNVYGLYEYHAKLRGMARSVYSGAKECYVCAYSLHVDICHIEPVASFPMTTTIDVVNSPTNLVALCRNHHWEFDHGYLELDVKIKPA